MSFTLYVPKSLFRALEEEKRKAAYEQRRRDEELRAQWYRFGLGWKKLGLAAAGKIHLVSHMSHDETEVWCGEYSLDGDNYSHTVDQASCRECLRLAIKYGQSAFTQIIRLNSIA